jgi:hypothetical protein
MPRQEITSRRSSALGLLPLPARSDPALVPARSTSVSTTLLVKRQLWPAEEAEPRETCREHSSRVEIFGTHKKIVAPVSCLALLLKCEYTLIGATTVLLVSFCDWSRLELVRMLQCACELIAPESSLRERKILLHKILAVAHSVAHFAGKPAQNTPKSVYYFVLEVVDLYQTEVLSIGFQDRRFQPLTHSSRDKGVTKCQ